MEEHPWSRKGDSLVLALKIQPGSPKNEIRGIREGELLMRIQGIPEKGKANKALIRFLSKSLKISQNQIELKRGDTSRHKVLSLPAEIEEKLIFLINSSLQEGENGS